MSLSRFSFSATMEILGRSVRILPGGRIGTQWNYGKPTLFHFFCSGNICSFGVAEGEEVGYVNCDKDGYLHLQSTARMFYLADADTGLNLSGADLQNNARISLHAFGGGPVLQFEGADGFKDVEVHYNFLIAANKVKIERIDRSFTFIVPNGNGAWIDYPKSGSYDPEPVSIVLDVKSIEVQAS